LAPGTYYPGAKKVSDRHHLQTGFEPGL